MTRRIPSAYAPFALTILLVLCAGRGTPAFAGEADDDPGPVLQKVELDDGRDVKEPGDDDQPTIIGRRRAVPHANSSGPAAPALPGTPRPSPSKASGPSWLIWVRVHLGHFVHILR